MNHERDREYLITYQKFNTFNTIEVNKTEGLL